METNYKQRILPRHAEPEEKNEIFVENPMIIDDLYSELEPKIEIDLETIDV